jgi:uncharacterized SAM-binding protein YcdF (DUF218 family)
VRTLFDIFLVWPMPALWLLLPGLILLRRRLGRTLVVASGVVLLVGSTPLVGSALLGFLERGASGFDMANADVARYDAIVVPLAGAYEDPAGRWWPLPDSVGRAVRGQQLQAVTGLPLVVVGGAPFPNQSVPEAVALQRVIALPPDTIVETKARDTFETAQAVAEILVGFEGGDRPRRVVIVTDGSHVRRMTAALRRFGVAAAAPPPARRYTDPRVAQNVWLDLVPSARGARLVRRGLHEITAIGWYLASGRIGPGDL